MPPKASVASPASRVASGPCIGLLALVCLIFHATANAQEPLAPDRPQAYQVSRFELDYLHPHPDLPAVEQLLQTSLRLGFADGVYYGPEAGVRRVQRTIAALNDEPTRLYDAAAVQAVIEAVLDELVTREFMGVFVAPDPTQIDRRGRDLRDEDETVLRLIIGVGRVADVRTLAYGERFDVDEAENLPVHERLIARSPFAQGDLLNRRALSDYAARTSRHPGRRVDAAVSAAPQPGGVSLDYLVTENKPWAVYFRTGNTGTAQTGKWRQEFGFFHNQLTNNDDILQLQYVTAEFDDYHAARASYEAPLLGIEPLRWRVVGNYAEFTATDVGIFAEDFEGRSWNVGGELIGNVYQRGDFFVDVFAGARYLDVDVESPVPFPARGREQFVLPRLGVRTEWEAVALRHRAMLQVEGQAGDATNVSTNELDDLGRPGASRGWLVLSWMIEQRAFIDALLRDLEAAQQADRALLAHELLVRFRGQYGFDNRLIPQAQQVAGGLYTVRGYRESLVAGDDVYLLTGEYRLHVPRLFGLRDEPRELFGDEFRVRPQSPYGPTDWDLALRAFIDVARVESNAGRGFVAEPSETLVGTGVGFDLAYRQNARVGLDWGIALSSTDRGDTSVGSSRLHLLVTVLY